VINVAARQVLYDFLCRIGRGEPTVAPSLRAEGTDPAVSAILEHLPPDNLTELAQRTDSPVVRAWFVHCLLFLRSDVPYEWVPPGRGPGHGVAQGLTYAGSLMMAGAIVATQLSASKVPWAWLPILVLSILGGPLLLVGMIWTRWASERRDREIVRWLREADFSIWPFARVADRDAAMVRHLNEIRSQAPQFFTRST